jgi:hypothetical protein
MASLSTMATVGKKLPIEKVFWLLGELVTESVTLDDNKGAGVIEEVTGVNRKVKIKLADGKHRLVTVEQAFRGYVTELIFEGAGKGGFPYDLKRLAVKLLERMQEHKEALSKARSVVKKGKRKKADLHGAVASEVAIQEKAGGLPKDADRHTLATLAKKFDSLAKRTDAAGDAIEHLEEQALFVFQSWEELLGFFADLGAGFSRRALALWAKGERLGGKGRKTALDPEVEQALLETVLHCDKMGYSVGKERIKALAHQMVEDPDIAARFGDDGPTDKWYAGWFKRASAKTPGLIKVLARGTDHNTIKWFNTANVNWWFDCFVRNIKNHKFAREPKEGEVGEAVWIEGQKERVIVMDETGISGKNKADATRKRVVTTKARVETGSGTRRLAPNVGATEEHITLLATVNLMGEAASPILIFSAEKNILPSSRAKVAATMPTCGGEREHDLGTFIGQTITDNLDGFIGVSPAGGITRENITELMVHAINRWYPDVADEPRPPDAANETKRKLTK